MLITTWLIQTKECWQLCLIWPFSNTDICFFIISRLKILGGTSGLIRPNFLRAFPMLFQKCSSSKTCDILSQQWRKESVRKVLIFDYHLRRSFQALIPNTWNGIWKENTWMVGPKRGKEILSKAQRGVLVIVWHRHHQVENFSLLNCREVRLFGLTLDCWHFFCENEFCKF